MKRLITLLWFMEFLMRILVLCVCVWYWMFYPLGSLSKAYRREEDCGRWMATKKVSHPNEFREFYHDNSVFRVLYQYPVMYDLLQWKRNFMVCWFGLWMFLIRQINCIGLQNSVESPGLVPSYSFAFLDR